jgi:hypothetical protein
MLCKAAGSTTRIEDVETLKQNNIDTKNRRVDAICDNFLPGIPMAFDDHSIADPPQTKAVYR